MNDLSKNEETKQVNQEDLPETSNTSKPEAEVMPEAVIKDTEAMPDAEAKQESEELKADASEDEPSDDDVS